MNYNFLPLYPIENYYFLYPSLVYIYYPFPYYPQLVPNIPSSNHYTDANNYSILEAKSNNNLIDITDSIVLKKSQYNSIKTIKKLKLKRKKKGFKQIKKAKIISKVCPSQRFSKKKLNKLIKSDILTINNAKNNEQILTRNKDIKSHYFFYEKEMEKVYQDKFMFFMLRNFPNNFTFQNFYISKHIRSKRHFNHVAIDSKITPQSHNYLNHKCKKVWSPENNIKKDVEYYIKRIEKINGNKMTEEDMLEFLKENNYNIDYTLFLIKSNDIKYQEFVNTKNKLI